MASSLSVILQHRKNHILDKWEKHVTEALPAARIETKVALRDSIPEFLDDLILALERGFHTQKNEIVRFAHKHGAERATLSEYSIEDALFEYNLLRKIIFTELEEESKVTSEERNIILEAIHLGMAKAGAEYAKFQLQKLENERIKLEQEKERLRAIADIQPSLIGQVDRDLRYVFVNKAYEDWFNVPREELIGKRVDEVVLPESFSNLRAYFEKVLQGERVRFEGHLKYTNKIEKYVICTYSPDVDSTGKVRGVYISVSDYSEQRKTLEAFMRSEQQFRNLLNALPQISWMADKAGELLWVNERFYQYSGLKKSDALGQGWFQIFGDEFRKIGIEKFFRHIQQNDVWEETFPLKRYDGQWRWFLTRAIPIKDDAGKIGRWLGTCTDITEQKMISDDLQKEKAIRDKFISALSHDLRTPLTSATLSSQLIPRKTSDPTVSNLAMKITASLKRVDKMIEDLLDANRLRAGKKIIPKIEEFDLSALAKSTIQDLETIYGDRFVLDVPETFSVHLSPQGLRRIIENLCTNAIKYGSDSAPVSVQIREEQNFFELDVHNFGNPLREENKSQLFEEFVRARSEEGSEKKGWGIGLSIVKGVTEALGGEVDVTSDEQGTTFSIRLPRDARPATEIGNQATH